MGEKKRMREDGTRSVHFSCMKLQSLTADRDEQFFFLTGAIVGGVMF